MPKKKYPDPLKQNEKPIMLVTAILAILVIAFAGHGCHAFNDHFNLPDDHPGEVYMEGIIKDKIGLDVDLSPRSPENGSSSQSL